MPRRIDARRQIGAALDALDQAERSLGWSPQEKASDLVQLMKQVRMKLLAMYVITGWVLPHKLERYVETVARMKRAMNQKGTDG
jgi:hypothetical protein